MKITGTKQLFKKYGMIYPAATKILIKHNKYFFSLVGERIINYSELNMGQIFHLIEKNIHNFHFIDELYYVTFCQLLNALKKNQDYSHNRLLYEKIVQAIDEDYEQDFLFLSHMLFYQLLIFDKNKIYISDDLKKIYEDISSKIAYNFFKYDLDIISTYIYFNPHSINNKPSPLQRSLKMLKKRWLIDYEQANKK